MPRIRRGRKAKKRTPSRVGSLGSKAKPRSGTIRQSGGRTASRPTQFQKTRIRRPRKIVRPIRRRTYYGGAGYPRRYRSRPMSSCGCFMVFIILAIFWLIFLAPTLTINLDATLALVLGIAVVLVLLIVALWFIMGILDDDDDGGGSGEIRVIEHEKVLVVCPYCGAKNEQGITTCANCDAEI